MTPDRCTVCRTGADACQCPADPPSPAMMRALAHFEAANSELDKLLGPRTISARYRVIEAPPATPAEGEPA